MKITRATVKWFEAEQKQYGTQTALFNLQFTIAHSIAQKLIGKPIKLQAKGK